MRALILAALVATGFALVGSANVSAAPVSGASIDQAATATDAVTNVHWRHNSGRRYYRCHYRYQSWGRCWY